MRPFESWKPAFVKLSSARSGPRIFGNGSKASRWRPRRRTSTRDTQIRFSILPSISGYATVNPVSRIKPLRKRYSEEDKISILSAEETKHLFRAADQKIIPFLTLSFFCGIRRATLERLDWSDVKFDEARVIVPKHKSKNQSRYRVSRVRTPWIGSVAT
jgi:integrase